MILALEEKAKAGNRDALGHLIHQTRNSVIPFLTRQFGNAHLVEDAFQEATYLILRANNFNGKANINIYVTIVTKRCCIDILRKQKVRSHLSLDAKTSNGNPESDDDGSASLFIPDTPPTRDFSEEQSLILEHLEEIRESKPDLHEVICLIKMRGLNYQQAGRVLGIPLGTVKSRLNAATNFLIESIEAKMEQLTKNGVAHVGI